MMLILQKILLCALSLAVAGLMVPIAMRIAMDPYVYEDVALAPHADTALVLGASVAHGAPSPVLAQRADTAITLYRNKSVSKILVTGDSEDMTHDEVTPVYTYLIRAGIPSNVILLDHSGFDTYSSMYRAREVYHVPTILIVTQDFHLPRALWIARHLGMQAYGVVAGNGGSVRDYAREIPASFKALIDTIMGRKPRDIKLDFQFRGSEMAR